MPRVVGLCALWIAGLSPLSAQDSAGPEVAVTGGEIRGVALAAGGDAFRGVPFAAPPINSLRWRAPAPVVPWTGIRNADRPGAPAYQANAGWNKAFADKSSEDCLYLDVWTPSLRPATAAPVMVWIHGGGNVAGAGGADPLYDGRAFIKRGVVLVVIEYRLGILGFLAHPELSRESPRHVSGNYGLLDQLAALRWVHTNIGRFGGDAGNVTIVGQSAGAIDIFALLATPQAKDLVQKAIAESGPLSPEMVQSLDAGEQAGADMFRDHGGRVLPLAALRGLPPDEVLKHGRGVKPFTVDGWVFPISPVTAWRRHRELAVPLIEGSNAVEFPFAGTKEQLVATIRSSFGPDADRALALYGLNGSSAAADPRYGDSADQWGSDFFRCLPMVDGGWHADAGRPVWQYEFDRAIPPAPRTAHSAELAYVFGNLSETGSLPGAFTEADHHLSGLVQRYWTNFAKTGNPNGAGLPRWDPYHLPAAVYLDFTEQGQAVTAQGARAPFRELFQAQLERLTEGD